MKKLVSTLCIVTSIVVAGAAPAAAASRLAPNDIQTIFFNGQPFTAATPTNVKYKMTFTADGSVSREPIGKKGAKDTGTWKLSKDGYCTTWKGSKPNCFTIVAKGSNKWSVMSEPTARATWAK